MSIYLHTCNALPVRYHGRVKHLYTRDERKGRGADTGRVCLLVTRAAPLARSTSAATNVARAPRFVRSCLIRPVAETNGHPPAPEKAWERRGDSGISNRHFGGTLRAPKPRLLPFPNFAELVWRPS